MTPLISVVMSVHNQTQFVASAIQSILNQTLTNFEFIIIDDGSNHLTHTLLKSFRDKRIRFSHHQTRRGVASCLNQALTKAQGKYIVRMDADDIAAPERLKVQFNYLTSHPKVAMCGTAVTLINTTGQSQGVKRFPTSPSKLKQVVLRYNPFIHPTVMLRHSALKQVGLYDEGLNGAEDYDLWLRLAAKFPVVNLHPPLLQYRINPHGVSWNSLKRTELQALKARIKALIQYGYPWWQAIYLIKPSLSYLIPAQVKKRLFQVE